jgi:hypothetical protein
MHVSTRFSVALAMIGLVWSVGAGCGGKTIQYPEDHERYLRIDKAVESLREAYVGKNVSGLAALMVPMYVHWSGLWKKDPEDPGMRHRGHSRLQWVGTQSILLRGMQGDVPFGAKGRQALTSQSPLPSKK